MNCFVVLSLALILLVGQSSAQWAMQYDVPDMGDRWMGGMRGMGGMGMGGMGMGGMGMGMRNFGMMNPWSMRRMSGMFPMGGMTRMTGMGMLGGGDGMGMDMMDVGQGMDQGMDMGMGN